LESPGLPGRGREAAGTSFAAPHVSGVINLMLARGIEPSRIGPILEASAVDLGPAGWDGDYGHGLLNAYWALEEAVSFQVSVEKKAGGSWQQVKTFEKPLRDGELEPFVLAPGLYRVEAWLDMGKAGLLDRGDYYYRSPPLVLDDDSQVQAHLVLAELD
ncbi:MAG: hypothetical protein GX335_02985, partial [Firmicutes bacterium]|nr:hypothetical protein [Bacillota bacterium]